MKVEIKLWSLHDRLGHMQTFVCAESVKACHGVCPGMTIPSPDHISRAQKRWKLFSHGTEIVAVDDRAIHTLALPACGREDPHLHPCPLNKMVSSTDLYLGDPSPPTFVDAIPASMRFEGVYALTSCQEVHFLPLNTSEPLCSVKLSQRLGHQAVGSPTCLYEVCPNSIVVGWNHYYTEPSLCAAVIDIRSHTKETPLFLAASSPVTRTCLTTENREYYYAACFTPNPYDTRPVTVALWDLRMTPHPVFEKDLGTDILDAVVRPSSGPTAIVATRTRGVKAVKEDYLEGLPWSNAWQPKIPLQSGNFTLSDTALTLVFADAQSVLHWETFLRESDPYDVASTRMPDSLGVWEDRYLISPDPYPLCYTPTAFGEGNISYSSAAPDDIPLASQPDVFVPRSTAGPWAGLPGGGYRARSVPPRTKPPPSLQYMHASRLKDLDNYKANYRIREEVKAINASLKRVDMDEPPSDETQTRRPFPYNLTRYKRYVGLENGTGMDYIIPTLQLVYYVTPLRDAMVGHTCETEHCILCELGFLFHMMNLQSVEGLGYPVLPLNFVRTLRETKEARVLGLLPETDLRIDTKQRNPDTLRPLEAERAVIRCGLFFQFLLDRIHKEAITVSEQAGLIPSIFGASRSTSLTCIQHRGSSQQQSQTVFVWNLSWSTVLSRLQKFSDVFVELVASGMCECIFLAARCELCKEPSSTHSTVKQIESLPKVLVMNLNSTKPASHLFIRRPGFLPLRFTILPDNSVVRGEATNGTEYVLQAVAFNVEGEDNGVREGHLVLHVRLPNLPTPDDDFPSLQTSVETRCPIDKTWFQFNHYVVTKVMESDVLDCAPLWKFPVYVVYAKKAFDVVKSSSRRCIFRKDTPGPVKPVVSARHILHEANLAVNARRATFVPLTEEEILKLTEGSGMTVALDAEFVEMSHASTAHGADGLDDGDDNAVLLHSLARLSVIRGDEGERYSLPILDHFVIHRHAPSDYLTQYSGLVPGDLEPITSQHHLATKKDVYLKLRFLVDHGCIFVGHGLQQDFRIINLVVPKEQVIDTVDLFRKPGERLVSLKFLAAFLLKQSIQTYIHDSIEDARTALELYRFYRRNTAQMPRILESLYSCGYDVGWLPDKAIDRELPQFEV